MRLCPPPPRATLLLGGGPLGSQQLLEGLLKLVFARSGDTLIILEALPLGAFEICRSDAPS
jgi:hypothetical protein